MADWGICPAPYHAALALAAWAAERWDYIDGRLALAGLLPETLSFARLLNVIYALVVDEPNGLVNREEVRAGIEEAIEKIAPSRETWGTSKRAQQGQDALMKMLEG